MKTEYHLTDSEPTPLRSVLNDGINVKRLVFAETGGRKQKKQRNESRKGRLR
jgi:hypothetical protein